MTNTSEDQIVKTDNPKLSAIRGGVLTFQDDPFLVPAEAAIVYESDAIIVISDGKIIDWGAAVNVKSRWPGSLEITEYANSLILAGFIDCHVHYPQAQIIGAYGKQLIDWLTEYTFVAEAAYADKEYAKAAAKLFLQECLRNGTTTSSVFCTVHPESVDAFFEESEKLEMRNIAGKVLMDRNAPAELCETPQQGYDQTQALIQRWHGKGRQLYSVTPRFALTSSDEQMEMTGAVWQENPGTFLQTHISESEQEVAWAKQLFPQQQNYLDIYQHFNQIGPRAILGHGIHLSETELACCFETGTAIAHCPTSNLFLGSGLFDLANAKKRERSLRVGLATDLGAGTSFSMLQTLNETYKVAQLKGFALNSAQAFYLATQGSAKALYLDDQIGSIAIGMEADLVVLDLQATPAIEYRMSFCQNINEVLFVLMTLGDDRAVQATYVNGALAHRK